MHNRCQRASLPGAPHPDDFLEEVCSHAISEYDPHPALSIAPPLGVTSDLFIFAIAAVALRPLWLEC